MKDHPKFFTALIFIMVGLLSLFVGVSGAMTVGKFTNSGLLGICGPYGKHADLVGVIFLGSFPVAIIVAFFAAKFFYHRITDETG